MQFEAAYDRRKSISHNLQILSFLKSDRPLKQNLVLKLETLEAN